MSNFMDLVKQELDSKIIASENGAAMYGTSGSALLDMYFKVSSYRNCGEEEIIRDFTRAYAENPELALKWMFYIGDVREGLGERRLFRILIKHVLPEHKNLISFVGEYNRFDSLLELFGTDAEKEMVAFVNRQLTEDIKASLENKPCSLLAKWMPSINTSSDKARGYAKKFCRAFGKSAKEYRKTLAEMRKYIGVIEQKMCAGEWTEIDYNTVPSKANLLYKNAFLKNDKERRSKYLEDLANGKAKINSSVVFPHDIIHKYMVTNKYNATDTVLEEMWKALPNKVDPSKPIMVIRDGSGSMEDTIAGTTVSALNVATALTIYFSERTSPAFKDKFITFSAKSELIDMSNLSSLAQKLYLCDSYNDCSNTNIEKVFDHVLNIAVNNHLKQEEIPTLLIVSDMEFDYVGGEHHYGSDNWGSIFDEFRRRFEAHGYKLPKLVFWNVMSRKNGIPLQTNELGVTLVSGFSVNTCNMVMTNELDPLKALVAELSKERYAKIK